MSNNQSFSDLVNPHRIRPSIVTFPEIDGITGRVIGIWANSFEYGAPHQIPVWNEWDPALDLIGNHAAAAIELMRDREWYADYNLVMADGAIDMGRSAACDTYLFAQIPVRG